MEEKFKRLQFTRDWTSALDFPTYEENEAQVRADLQVLHDETKAFINEKLIPGIESLAVPGTGDMKLEVYDTRGKKTDIYDYAEEQAAQAASQVLEQARQESEAMKQAARKRLDLAAELIVEKVVKR